MAVDWLETMQKLAAGARAKVAEDHRPNLKSCRHKRPMRAVASRHPLPAGEPPNSDHHCWCKRSWKEGRLPAGSPGTFSANPLLAIPVGLSANAWLPRSATSCVLWHPDLPCAATRSRACFTWLVAVCDARPRARLGWARAFQGEWASCHLNSCRSARGEDQISPHLLVREAPLFLSHPATRLFLRCAVYTRAQTETRVTDKAKLKAEFEEAIRQIL